MYHQTRNLTFRQVSKTFGRSFREKEYRIKVIGDVHSANTYFSTSRDYLFAKVSSERTERDKTDLERFAASAGMTAS